MKPLALILLVPALAAAMPTAYSCDRIVEGAISGRTAATRLYVAGAKIRMESESAITILRKDLGLVWMLSPQRKTYIETPAGHALADPTRDPLEGATKQILGKEMMNGYQCTRMRVTRKDPKLGSISAVIWLADKIGMPVRTETDFRGHRIVENRKNIVLAAPPDSLFEIPPGYTKTKLGGGSAPAPGGNAALVEQLKQSIGTNRGGAQTAAVELPAWLEAYPKVTMRCSAGEASARSCAFTTRDNVPQVAEFYQNSLSSRGFKLNRSDSRGGVPLVSMKAAGNGVRLNVAIGVDGSGQTAVKFTWSPAR